MKKIYILLSFFIFQIFLFTSCNKDDDNDNNNPSYVGTWKYSQSISGTSLSNTLVLKTSSFTETIKTNISVLGINESSTSVFSGTLSISGDQITFNIEKTTVDGVNINTSSSKTYTFEVVDNKFKRKSSSGEEVFTKQ